MKIRIIGVPSAWGTLELGAQRTPGLLRDAGLAAWLAAAGHEVDDGGDVSVPAQDDNDLRHAEQNPASSTVQVAAMARAVRAAVTASLRDGYLPLLLGGECSLSIGAVPALAQHNAPVTVAWLDAHGDLNTPETSSSGLLTGMPLAVVLGEGPAELTAVGSDVARPATGATFLIGGRDLDPGEVTNMERFGVRHVDTAAARSDGPEEVAMQVLGVPEIAVIPPEARAQLVAGDAAAAAAVDAAPRPNLYLHFDVDVLDPDYAPGVHYRVDGGFDPAEVGTLAGYLCASGCVSAIAVASANLDHDTDGRTIAAIRDVFSSIADALATL